LQIHFLWKIQCNGKRDCINHKTSKAPAQLNGEKQIITIDLDSRSYGIEGRGKKTCLPE